jgi:IS605 OrfB family transposase
MAFLTLDGRWIHVNSAFCNILGYTKNELLNLTFHDITHPDDLTIGSDDVQKLLEGRIDKYQFEKRYIHKLGTVIWVQVCISLLRDEQGKPLYFMSQTQNISAQKTGLEQLKRIEKLYHLISGKQLKKLQRIVSRRKKGSSRRKKAVTLLAKKHESIAIQRKNNAHQVSRQLVNHYDLIAFEDLKITNMVKNHHLAKSIVDAGWNQLVQFTTYKAESAGKRVVLVDPRNTSQQCSNCDERVKKTLAVRTHRCPSCGFECDRDVNTAKNILKRGVQQLQNVS